MLLWCIRSAVSDVMPGDAGLPGVVDAGWDTFIARFRREANGPMWLGLVVGTVVYVSTPLITVGWPLPSFWLPREVRDRHAYRILTHRVYLVRQAAFLLKFVAGICWGGDPAVREAIGMRAYGPDPDGWRTG